MNNNQMWATLAAITAFFSLINTILALSLSKNNPMKNFYVFTALVLASTVKSGTLSAFMIFVERYEQLNDTFVEMAKATIAFAFVFHLQIAVTMGMGSSPKNQKALFALSIIYLVLAAISFYPLFFWERICDAEEL